MFIRQCYRKKNGKRHAYCALVESYRTDLGPRQRVVAYLGDAAADVREGVKHAAKNQTHGPQKKLFDDTKSSWAEVDTSRVRVERCREFAGPWLALQLLRKVSLDEFFAKSIPSGREEIPWPMMAARGYSRHHRSDCKQVCIGLVVSTCGMALGDETFILCRSADRREKEKAMHARFEKRIEEGLKKTEEACTKRKHKLVTIAKRVGRLLGRNTRAAGLFVTDVKQAADGRAILVWSKNEACRDWANLSEGCYLLRTNISDWTAEELWQAYMQLTQAEAAFRIHKSDLRIRPVWHQKTERVQAHILVCFLAYVLWKTLAQLCRQAGLGDEPRRVLDEIKRIRLVDVVLPTRQGIDIRKRCVARPDDHQQILLQRLGLKLPQQLKMTDM